MSDETLEYLPFHAINDFMRDDYRLEVIRSTLQALPGLPADFQTAIDQLTRTWIQVPGFRNSSKAPAGKRIKPTTEAFEKNPALVAAILSAWAESHKELRQQVYDVLMNRGWAVLPPAADRTQLPGFLARWPAGEDFETLGQAFRDANPEGNYNSDDISLMVVWLSGRLPYKVEDEEEAEGEEDTA